jgi:hypothetical protein
MKIKLVLLLVVANYFFLAQKTYFGEEPVRWERRPLTHFPENLSEYTSADIVILEDSTEFYFFSTKSERLVRHLVLKINNQKGVEALARYSLPESFDVANDAFYYRQGRQTRIKSPFIREFRISQLGGRRLTSGIWSDLKFDYRYEDIRWIGNTGKFIDDQLVVFEWKDVRAGDVIEIMYELEFNSHYGSNIFYFYSKYPKLHCQYIFNYSVNTKYADYAFILPLYIKDSLIKSSFIGLDETHILKTDRITIGNINAVNYPANSFAGRSLPHVYVDFRFYRVLLNSYSAGLQRIYETEFKRPKNFEWVFIRDTTNYYTKIYDRQFASIRKFVATLPPIGSDSSHKLFFKALCDTFNCFRYITSNSLFYNESNLYNVSSGDHLLKRRIVGSAWGLCVDILNDNKMFYYTVNIQDKRLGEHSLYYRAHYDYESKLIAMPSGNSYIYFIPRNNGLKYNLNELPFYYEGALAVLQPRNFQQETEEKLDKYSKFIKTHKGTFNENTRIENARVNILLDSLKARLTTKESLSGQFSTVLRPLYLNDCIDSTIAPYYFRKCTDKPNASEVKIKLSSSISDFPFRYTFNCSEKVILPTKTSINLNKWFSFLISKSSFPEMPSHDYYFDFDYTDSYNFLLDFSAPVEVNNSGDFTKRINNDFFEVESEIVKNSESSYLLKVKVVVKQRKVPSDKMNLLTEVIQALETINSFSLELAAK